MATIANSRQLRRLSVLAACLIAIVGCQPPGPKALLEGERLMGEGKFTEAVTQLRKAVELLPQNAQAWNHFGLALHRSDRPDDALKAYQQAILLDRNLAPARFNLGMLYYEQGRFSDAANELTTYTALQPTEQAAWVRLADSLFRAKRVDEAERAYVSAYRLNQTDPETLNGLGLMQLQRRRVRDAQAWFQASLKADPSFPPALFNMAVLHHHYIVNKPLALQRYKEYAAIQPPAENAGLAAEMARQLEAELYPRQATNNPSITSTNVVQARPVATNTPPVATNTVLARLVTNALPTVRATANTNLPAPAPKPATNPSPAVATLAKPPVSHPATNAVTEKPVEKAVEKPAVAVAAPVTNPPPKIVKEAAPAPTPEPPKVEVPAAKLEVVRVKEEDPIPPVKDVTSAQVIRTPVTENAPEPPAPVAATVNNPPSSNPATIAETPGNPSVVRKVQPREKKSIWTKANPINWFGDKEAKAEKPLTVLQPVLETPKPSTPPPAPLPLGPYTPPASMPRYAYRNPSIALSGNRTTAEPLYARGAAAHQDGNLAQAIELYRQAIQADPSYYEPRANLGLAAYRLRDYPQALYYLEEATAANPSAVNARYNFALALQAANYPYDATLELKKLLANSPSEARAYFLLGTIYSQTLNSPAHAAEPFRKVLELEPNHPQAEQIRRWLTSYAP